MLAIEVPQADRFAGFARQAARFVASVVLPLPPFGLATKIARMTAPPPSGAGERLPRRGQVSLQSVMAPLLAVETSFMYFASRPLV